MTPRAIASTPRVGPTGPIMQDFLCSSGYPGLTVDIASGALSGLSGLDIDVQHDAHSASWLAAHPQVPSTPRFRPGRGGLYPLPAGVGLNAIVPEPLRNLVRKCIEMHLPLDWLALLSVAEQSERDILLSWVKQTGPA